MKYKIFDSFSINMRIVHKLIMNLSNNDFRFRDKFLLDALEQLVNGVGE